MPEKGTVGIGIGGDGDSVGCLITKCYVLHTGTFKYYKITLNGVYRTTFTDLHDRKLHGNIFPVHVLAF